MLGTRSGSSECFMDNRDLQIVVERTYQTKHRRPSLFREDPIRSDQLILKTQLNNLQFCLLSISSDVNFSLNHTDLILFTLQDAANYPFRHEESHNAIRKGGNKVNKSVPRMPVCYRAVWCMVVIPSNSRPILTSSVGYVQTNFWCFQMPMSIFGRKLRANIGEYGSCMCGPVERSCLSTKMSVFLDIETAFDAINSIILSRDTHISSSYTAKLYKLHGWNCNKCLS